MHPYIVSSFITSGSCLLRSDPGLLEWESNEEMSHGRLLVSVMTVLFEVECIFPIYFVGGASCLLSRDLSRCDLQIPLGKTLNG